MKKTDTIKKAVIISQEKRKGFTKKIGNTYLSKIVGSHIHRFLPGMEAV